MAKNRRRKTPSKRGAIIALVVVFLLTLCAGYLGLRGMPLRTPHYLAPWLPVNDARTGQLTKALSLGLDLNGGVFVEFDAERPEGEDMTDDGYLYALQNTVEALRKRLSNGGYTEATVQIVNNNTGIRAEVPINLGQDASSTDQITAVQSLLGRTAKLSFRGPDGVEFMDGSNVTSAGSALDTQTGRGYYIGLNLTNEGAKLFEDMTRRSINQNISIWLDDEMLMNPTVNEIIPGGQVMITGGFTQETAAEFANQISSGALPLSLKETNSSIVSATLGANALTTAVTAGMIGIAVIMLIMLLRYRLNGVVASWALTIYVVLLFLLIAALRIQITLPGLAGIVLGIGMAVDANVIIYERFNEELRAGRAASAAAQAGFRNALSAILDANVTTLIAGVVLLIFGTGPVQGFAKTLLLGVVVSMFCAVVVTRFLMKRFIRAGLNKPGLFCRMPAQGQEEVQ